MSKTKSENCNFSVGWCIRKTAGLNTFELGLVEDSQCLMRCNLRCSATSSELGHVKRGVKNQIDKKTSKRLWFHCKGWWDGGLQTGPGQTWLLLPITTRFG